jgi:hypothetical protein
MVTLNGKHHLTQMVYLAPKVTIKPKTSWKELLMRNIVLIVVISQRRIGIRFVMNRGDFDKRYISKNIIIIWYKL